MSTRSFISFLFGAILVLTACSSGEADGEGGITEGITFRSVDEIIDGELEIANFANDGTANPPTLSACIKFFSDKL